MTFANRSRQAAVRFDLTFGPQLQINREQQLSIEDLVNSRLRAIATVVLVWAVIYLPALGSIAIKGEEGRRILPAVRMLETGNYLVPQVGSNPYYRKPPLVNWLVAASFKFCGVRNEWTARLPSALSVLAVAIAFVTIACASLGARGSIIAAMIWLTNIGIVEKGRLIEIEALYVSLCGLAIILWLSFFLQKKSPWLTWLPASVFLGLGLLAKGPTHLLFFYGIVIAVVAYWKNWRVLVHPAHFVALVVMIGIAAAWAIPFVHGTTSQVAIDKWSGQVHRTAERHRFQILRLDPKRTPWPDLFSPVASPVSVCTIFKIAGAKRTATGARVVLGNCSTVFGGQSCPRRARPVQHAGNSSSIVATRYDLRRQRVAMSATLDERRARLGQGGGRVRWDRTCDWCDRLSGYGDRVKKQAAGKKGRRRNQCARGPERDALRR